MVNFGDCKIFWITPSPGKLYVYEWVSEGRHPVREGFKQTKKVPPHPLNSGNIFFIWYMGSKKCFNVKKFFFLFSGKFFDTKFNKKMEIVSNWVWGNQGVKKKFFAFLDGSDHA